MVRELNSGRSIGGEIVSKLTALTSHLLVVSLLRCYSRRREKGRGETHISNDFSSIQTTLSLPPHQHASSFLFFLFFHTVGERDGAVRFSDSTRPHLTIRNLNLSKNTQNKAEETRGLFKRIHKHKKYTKWQHI